MITSWLDLVPFEATRFLGYAAWVTVLIGIGLWATGVAVARVAVALLLGLAGATLAALMVSYFHVDLSPVTATILGFVVGVVSGVLGFKFLQAITLAAALGLAVSGLYYTWHVSPAPEGPAATTQQVSELKIPVEQFEPEPTQDAEQQRVKLHLGDLAERVMRRIGSIPTDHSRRMCIAGLGSVAIGLLIALGFPRATTAVITSILGSVLMIGGISLGTSIYRPGQPGFLPATATGWYVLCGILTAVGIIIQYSLFMRRSDKGPKQAADATQAS